MMRLLANVSKSGRSYQIFSPPRPAEAEDYVQAVWLVLSTERRGR
jgi:hypothetical protein